MKNILKLSILLAFVLPISASAAWWNPSDWFKSTEVSTTTKVEPVIENNNKGMLEEISELRKENASLMAQIVELKLPKTATVSSPSIQNSVQVVTLVQTTLPTSSQPFNCRTGYEYQKDAGCVLIPTNEPPAAPHIVTIKELEQQIIDIKKDYYSKVDAIRSSGASSIGEGLAQRFTDQTNQKIDQINLQIQQIELNGGQ